MRCSGCASRSPGCCRSPVRGRCSWTSSPAGCTLSPPPSVARRLEALHAELHEGPCLHAARTGSGCCSATSAARMPPNGPPLRGSRAGRRGGSRLQLPLRTADQRVGSLSLCSDTPADLDEADLKLAQLLVNVTAASIVAARSYQQGSGLLPAAGRRLADTAVLEQAKGRLSVQLGVTPEAALQHLRRAAAPEGMPLAAVAEQVATGVPPATRHRRRPPPRTRDTAPPMPASPLQQRPGDHASYRSGGRRGAVHPAWRKDGTVQRRPPTKEVMTTPNCPGR